MENQEENIEKIKMISQLMGREPPKEMELMKMMETAKKMQMFFEPIHTITEKKGQAKETIKNPTAQPKNEELFWLHRNKEENMISAAIPFLDKEYQKNLYVIVRLLEMKRVLQTETPVMLEARSRSKEDIRNRQKKVLQAVSPFLTGEERKNIDFLVKAMEFKTTMEWKEENQ